MKSPVVYSGDELPAEFPESWGFTEFAQTKLTMPMLVLTGDKASGNFLIEQARIVNTDVQSVVKGSGHRLIDAAPREVIPQLASLLNKSN